MVAKNDLPEYCRITDHCMRLKADLLLLLVALLWGSAFAVMRVAAKYDIILLLNGFRFLLGGLLLLPFIKKPKNFTKHNWLLVFLAGFALFAAVFFQQAGLATTTAGNAGFITILYVVVVPIILWIGWREKPKLITWLAVTAAVVGGYLLSTGGSYRIARGDGLIFIGSLFWAMHVVVVGKAQGRIALLPFAAGQYLFCGIINLAVGVFIEQPSLAILSSIIPAILYTAVFSIAAGFTLQVFAQKHTPPNDAALILSMEAIFAAFFGWIFLNEQMAPIQVFGCSLIVMAVIFIQLGGGKMQVERRDVQ